MDGLTELLYIGTGLAGVIDEYIQSGRSSLLDELEGKAHAEKKRVALDRVLHGRRTRCYSFTDQLRCSSTTRTSRHPLQSVDE